MKIFKTGTDHNLIVEPDKIGDMVSPTNPIVDKNPENEIEPTTINYDDFNLDNILSDNSYGINIETILDLDFIDTDDDITPLKIGNPSITKKIEHGGIYVYEDKNSIDEFEIGINTKTSNNFLEIRNYNKFTYLYTPYQQTGTYLENNEFLTFSYDFYIVEDLDNEEVSPYFEFLTNSKLKSENSFKIFGVRYDKIGIQFDGKNEFYGNTNDIFEEPITNKWRKLTIDIHNKEIRILIDNFKIHSIYPTIPIDIQQFFILLYPNTTIYFDNIKILKTISKITN
jgi:hypothetical protein